MVRTLCPVCGQPLTMEKPAWHCDTGHSFDVARQGYVNLLTVDRKHSKQPGDSTAQVEARRAFLSAGYYAPMAARLAEIVAGERPRTILDAGCGEGYYLTELGKALPETERWGIDISREAVRRAAGRDKQAHWLTATAAHLPFADGSFDCALSLFALTAAEEFHRVLRPGGLFLQVVAGPDHLRGLRTIIYDTVAEKEKERSRPLPGFVLERSETVEFSFTLTETGRVLELLAMTPHFMRISKAGADRARAAEGLTDTFQAVCNGYRAI